MVTFFKREATLAVNGVNSGNLQYVAATPGDYDLYKVGDQVDITDHLGNVVLKGWVKDKTRTNGSMVGLYIEDSGHFLRDYNVEDNAPDDGEPIYDTIGNIIQDYILPDQWVLDQAALPVKTSLDWPVAYAVRNGTALKHINTICDMLSFRWVADVVFPYPDPKDNVYRLSLYPLNSPTSVATSTNDLHEFRTTSAFKGGDTARHFITQIQVVGGEPEVGQKITYSQSDSEEFAYLESSDTYCKSLDLSPGTTIVDVRDGSIISGWETTVSTIFKFEHDDNYYWYEAYDGVSVRNISAFPYAPWKATDPASIQVTGLAVSHATNDEMYLVGAYVVDREVAFPFASPATTWMWVGSEVIGFESAVASGGKTTFASLTRGLNGVRYVHRQGTMVRPYIGATGGASLSPMGLYGKLSNSISVSGFTEMDGLDKVAAGVLRAATVMYTGSSQKLVATLDAAQFYPGVWVNTTPASILQSGSYVQSATDVPAISMVKSITYSLGAPLKVEFGTNIPTIVRNSKEAVTAFDLTMQRPQQSKAGEVLEYSTNKTAALMKFSKDTKERIRLGEYFDPTEETNYTTKWVRVK
jgi:hypothetical protein